MADDVAVTPGVGKTVATEDIGGRQFQLVKPAWGAAGSANLVSAALPIPVGLGLKTSEACTRLVLSFAASGDNAIVAASGGLIVRIYAILLVCATPVGVKFIDTTPTNLTGVMTFGVGGGLFLGQQGEPHYSTAVGKGFSINLSAAVQVSGTVWYTQVA